jgi:hypothetical protein
LVVANYLIVRDQRLEGKLSAKCDVWTVSKNSSVSSLVSNIKSTANANGAFDTIFELCHGYAGSNRRAQVSMDAGGMGLQLGSDGVLHSNVALWDGMAGSCSNLVVYACAAANTERGNEGSTADGKYLMGALAIHANATVYAADRIQWYDPDSMDFGDWEGNLWCFPASGAPPSIVGQAPVEVSQVLS